MSSSSGEPVLAVYDFRSKQEYIYRTNRMRQITGASELIAGMYRDFLRKEVRASSDGKARGGRIWKDWDGVDLIGQPVNPRPLFTNGAPNLGDGELGIVVYEGGGNLLVLYRNRREYANANRTFSRMVMEKAYGLSMISACAPWPADTGEEGFEEARIAAFRALDRAKRIGDANVPTNVLPYTLVSRSTFQPICKRESYEGDHHELSREEVCKEGAFRRKVKEDEACVARAVAWEDQGKYIDDLGTEKGRDSLIAVMYFDGNSIGERVKSVLEGTKPADYVKTIRNFSRELHQVLVGNTVARMDEVIGLTAGEVALLNTNSDEDGDAVAGTLKPKQKGYRVIIDHGDEITVVCNAHAAPLAVDAYFEAISSSGYQACGGVAFCHSHDPFAEVYRIAEECCESGKKANRARQAVAMAGLEGAAAQKAARDANASFIDFHFCRSGITGTLSQIREAQEGAYTARPYRIGDSYDSFLRLGELLAHSKLQRSDIKELSRAILRGESWYRLAYERLKAKDPAAFGHGAAEDIEPDRRILKKLLFDVTSMWDVFDVRFEGEHGREAEVSHGA